MPAHVPLQPVLRPRRHLRLLSRDARLNIREGEVDGTDIGGLKVVMVADTPKVMMEGNWRLERKPARRRGRSQACETDGGSSVQETPFT